MRISVHIYITIDEIFPFEKTLIEFNANEVFNYSFMYLRDQYIIKQTICNN